MREMQFDVSEIKGGAGGRYRPLLHCGKTVMPEEFVSFFSGAINKPEPYATFILSMLRETIACLLQSGRPVNLGWMSFTPRLKGALRAKDASGDSERLEVSVSPSRAFRHCLRGIDVINVNQMSRPLLYEFMEDGQEKKNTLHMPGKRIVLNGERISIDRSHADEGVWLESLDGSCRNGIGTDFEPKRATRRAQFVKWEVYREGSRVAVGLSFVVYRTGGSGRSPGAKSAVSEEGVLIGRGLFP